MIGEDMSNGSWVLFPLLLHVGQSCLLGPIARVVQNFGIPTADPSTTCAAGQLPTVGRSYSSFPTEFEPTSFP